MRSTLPALLLAGALAACSAFPQNDTARMPQNSVGSPAMTQNEAIALPGWALRDPANTAGNPEVAARSIAALDWLAGQDSLTPDFGSYAPVAEWSWASLRREVRAAVGIAPGTPSQTVVERMFAAADDLKAGNRAAAAAQFQPPAFTLGPEGTIAALEHLPRFKYVTVSFTQLRMNENRGTCGSINLFC